MDVVVVSHTHWDREWYQPLGRMRQRLVSLVDELLESSGSADAAPFLLDGQAIVLEDYLDVRPDRAEALGRALRSGTIEAGPWYVLADELIPSGESLIRNLLAGRALLQRLGAGDHAQPSQRLGAGVDTQLSPPVLYCPDAFGHPAALPELALGFGLRTIILWRGHGGSADPAVDTVKWRGRDGSTVLLYHLSRSGYELGANLPADARAAERRWRELEGELLERAILGVALLPNGADHHAPQAERAAALAALVRAAAPHEVSDGGLTGFARMLESRASGRELPEVSGERRDSYGYTWSLQGTFASRAAQKRANARAERALLREAEPWIAVAMARRSRALEMNATLQASLDAAWRTLLACHPHDTLCGCSVDAVAQAMDERLSSATAQAHGLRDDALTLLLGADADSARGRRDMWKPSLIIRNPAARPRRGVVEVDLLTTIADEPVGPGSAGGVQAAQAALRVVLDPPQITNLPVVQLLGSRIRRERLEPARHYPDNDLVSAWRAVVLVEDAVPGYGLWSYELREAETARRPGDEEVNAGQADEEPHAFAPAEAGHDARGFWLRNDVLQVTVDTNGIVSLAVDGSPRVPDLLGFEWVADVGDLYTHQAAGAISEERRFLGARVRHHGPLRAELELSFAIRVPRSSRDTRRVELPLRLVLRAEAGSPLLGVRVRGTNRARDHRLRVRFRSGVHAAEVTADAAFAPVSRVPIAASDNARQLEVPPPTAPLHRYVTLSGSHAVTLVSDGLAEYESTESGDVLVTLVRAVGALSRGTLPNRPGHAGWPAATPGAQSRGPFAAGFALLFHPSGSDADSVLLAAEQAAEDALVPLVGTTWRWLLHTPAEQGGFMLEGRGLVERAIMPVPGGVHLRCVNLLDSAVGGRWRIPVGAELAGAMRVRLDGTPIAALQAVNGHVEFDAAPHETVTIALAFRQD